MSRLNFLAATIEYSVLNVFPAKSGLTKLTDLCSEHGFLPWVTRVSTFQFYFILDLVNTNPGDNVKSHNDQAILPDWCLTEL